MTLIGHDWRPTDIPHRCGVVLDIKKISATKSQLICVVCGKEAGVWVSIKKEKEYPITAKYLNNPEKYV